MASVDTNKQYSPKNNIQTASNFWGVACSKYSSIVPDFKSKPELPRVPELASGNTYFVLLKKANHAFHHPHIVWILLLYLPVIHLFNWTENIKIIDRVYYRGEVVSGRGAAEEAARVPWQVGAGCPVSTVPTAPHWIHDPLEPATETPCDHLVCEPTP